jgi:putative tricarboxylic transport membrane protein
MAEADPDPPGGRKPMASIPPPAGRRVSYGHVAFLVAIAGYAIWRLIDAREASTSFQNLLLIEPVVVVLLLLVAVIAVGLFRAGPEQAPVEAEPADPDAPPEDTPPMDDRRNVLRAFGAMGLTAAFLALVPFLGLDVATALFIATALLVQGERRPAMVLGVALIFGFGLVHAFKAILPTPIPTLFG